MLGDLFGCAWCYLHSLRVWAGQLTYVTCQQQDW
jgi:hypothetical protein